MTMMNSVKEFFGLNPNEYHDDYADVAPREELSSPRDYIRPTTNAIVTVVVNRYEDAPKIGTPFTEGDAVIFDMAGMSPADRNRIFDFATGLAFALSGTLRKVTDGVWALMDKNTPFSDHDLQETFFQR
ncbi:cell division protein SepF [Corynebacterium aquilae]|uniref:cell division protein SepF n=1 Tax=Corynebacterium aquilae TaxID=203263 RepID=UPI000951C942|nr:cell division protein SepF [Corynebacterium aquilae]